MYTSFTSEDNYKSKLNSVKVIMVLGIWYGMVWHYGIMHRHVAMGTWPERPAEQPGISDEVDTRKSNKPATKR